jgi:hypothetical protein
MQREPEGQSTKASAYGHLPGRPVPGKYIWGVLLLLQSCAGTYPVLVERTIQSQPVRQTLYLMDTSWQEERNKEALNLVFEKKDWPGALEMWTFMSQKKLALDCGLLSNLAVATFMNGQDAFARAEHAVRLCPEETIRHNFRIITSR